MKLEPGECEETEMNCSFRKTAVRWFAPAVFAIALTCFQTARATESTGLPESVAALDAPADPRDLIAAGRERTATDFRDLKAPLRSARGERNAAGRRVGRQLRVRREEERARLREVAAASWHYFGRSGTGLILGVGF